MELWSAGLVAVVVLGLALIVYGALADRARNRRAAAEMLAPPKRDIPQFRPDAPAPAYLSELQARHPSPVSTAEMTAAERQQLAEQLKRDSTVKLGAGYLSRDFVTDRESGQAVLDDPRVLVSRDRIESTRELLGVLEKLALSRTPLVVVAPSLADEVRSTLEVNQIRGTLTVLAVTPAGPADLQLVAEATGAQIRDRSDLQAGYVWPEHLGGCRRWVSNGRASFVVGPPGSGEPSG